MKRIQLKERKKLQFWTKALKKKNKNTIIITYERIVLIITLYENNI